MRRTFSTAELTAMVATETSARRRNYYQRVLSGMCVECSHRAAPGRRRCEVCAVANLERTERFMARRGGMVARRRETENVSSTLAASPHKGGILKGIETKTNRDEIPPGSVALKYIAEIDNLKGKLEAATREAMRSEQEVMRLRTRYATLESFVGTPQAKLIWEIERMRSVVDAAVDFVASIRSAVALPRYDLQPLYDAVDAYNTTLQLKNKEENNDTNS